MRLLALRSVFSSLVVVGLSACPGDDSGDDSNDSANTSSGSSTTDNTTGGGGSGTTDGAQTTSAGDTTTSGGDETSSDGGLVLGDIEVTVTYEGDAVGPLIVAVLTEFPPMGPPTAFMREEEPTFPWVGTFSELEAGEYFLLATIDVGDDNPTGPGPEDPQGMPAMSVVVDGEGPFPVEIAVVDPK